MVFTLFTSYVGSFVAESQFDFGSFEMFVFFVIKKEMFVFNTEISSGFLITV